jgi:hypothetical protein
VLPVPHDLEAAIAALNPDAPDAEAIAAAAQRADRIALDHPAVATLARTIARTLLAITNGDVQPHHAQWRLASATLTLRQEMDRDAPSQIAMAGAVMDLETLFPPLPSSAVAPNAEDVELVHPSELVRRPRA